MRFITIEYLHRTTGDSVRRAGASPVPLIVTDRAEPVAVIANLSLLKPRRRKRTLLPEFKALMARLQVNDVVKDLETVRGDR